MGMFLFVVGVSDADAAVCEDKGHLHHFDCS